MATWASAAQAVGPAESARTATAAERAWAASDEALALVQQVSRTLSLSSAVPPPSVASAKPALDGVFQRLPAVSQLRLAPPKGRACARSVPPSFAPAPADAPQP